MLQLGAEMLGQIVGVIALDAAIFENLRVVRKQSLRPLGIEPFDGIATFSIGWSPLAHPVFVRFEQGARLHTGAKKIPGACIQNTLDAFFLLEKATSRHFFGGVLRHGRQ